MSSQPRVIDSRVTYEGRIFSTVVEHIELPGRERPVSVEVVRHAGSVGIAAMPAADSLILVRQYRHAAGATMWELPAGSIDDGEDAETAARRECHEELGLVAGAAERLGELWPLPGYCTELMTFYRVTGLRQPGEADAAAHQDEDEDIETGVFTLAEVRRMLRSGELTDMKIAAVLALL